MAKPKNNDHNIHPATEGQQFTHGMEFFTVKAKCGVDRGNFYCITCKKVLRNPMEKDEHIERGRHVLTWVCAEHGPEVP